MSESGESKRSAASCLTSSVLPTPVGPTKMKLTGLCFGLMPTRPRRMAAATASTASSCPMMCFFRRSASSLRRLNSASRMRAGGNFRPQLDHAGEIVHRQLGIALRAETVQLALRLAARRLLQLGQALEVGILGLRLEQLALLGVIVQLAAQLHAAVDVLVVQVHIRARLVDQVDGLIRQEAVGDVALGEHDGLAQDTVGNFHAVEGLVVVGDALENFERILHARLVDRDGLEAALERGVLLDVLAVLVEGRRADDLNFAAREGGLQDIGGVHAALGVARADDVMHLVDDENDVAELADLLDKTLHAALELAAELRAGDERGRGQGDRPPCCGA